MSVKDDRPDNQNGTPSKTPSATDTTGASSPAGNPSDSADSNPALGALQKVVREIESGTAALGWDRPAMLYGLVPTKTLLATEGLPEDVRADLERSFDGKQDHLSAVLQDLAPGEEIEKVLPQIAWPSEVAGAAATLERVVVPTQVEEAAPSDPEEALLYFANHPMRTEVRLVAGVTRNGETWSAIRTRAFDDETSVVEGENLVPELIAALRLGFSDSQGAGR